MDSLVVGDILAVVDILVVGDILVVEDSLVVGNTLAIQAEEYLHTHILYTICITIYKI